MLRNSVLLVSTIALAAMATTAVAAVRKPPHDESCKRWELRGMTQGNWVNARKNELWICVSGDSKGRVSSASTSSGQPGSGTAADASSSGTGTSSGNPGKGNNGKGTPNGGKTDGGDPPGGGNTGNDGQG